MLQKEFNFSSLIIQNENGQFRLATGEEVIKAARREISVRFCRGTAITSPAITKDYIQLKLAHHEHEVFAVLWLDNRHRVLSFEELFRGTIDGACVFWRT